MSRLITKVSKAFNSLGAIFIGSAKSLNMPEDFYYESRDRALPHYKEVSWETNRQSLYIDTFRRELNKYVVRYVTIFGLVIGVGMFTLTIGVNGIHSLLRNNENIMADMKALEEEYEAIMSDGKTTKEEKARIEELQEDAKELQAELQKSNEGREQ